MILRLQLRRLTLINRLLIPAHNPSVPSPLRGCPLAPTLCILLYCSMASGQRPLRLFKHHAIMKPASDRLDFLLSASGSLLSRYQGHISSLRIYSLLLASHWYINCTIKFCAFHTDSDVRTFRGHCMLGIAGTQGCSIKIRLTLTENFLRFPPH